MIENTQEENPFDSLQATPLAVKKSYDRNPDKNPFDDLEVDEVWYKNIARTLLQVPKGIAKGATYGLDLMQMLGTFDALDPEEIDRIRAVSEREGIPFDEEKYLEKVQEAAEMFPTVENASRELESAYGIPLEAKTRVQKGIEFASMAGKMSPKGYTIRGTNTSLPRPVLGAAVSGTNEILKETGAPSVITEPLSFAILKKPTEGASSLAFGKKTKPSGLTERIYEKGLTEVDVTPSKHAKIQRKVEQDFRQITNELVKGSPIEETYNLLKSDAHFKSDIADKFKEVQTLSKEIPDSFSTTDIRKKVAQKYQQIETTGLSPSEYDKDYTKFMKQHISDIPEKNATPSDLVSQYRKNNKSLSEIYESGQSKAFNRAKKDALLDYNRIIAETIQERYPETEFSKLFEYTNKKWTEISDVENINSYIDDLFDGKINYKEAEKLGNPRNQESFKRSFGEEGKRNFQQLTHDLLDTQQSMKMVKIAEKAGFEDIVKYALYFKAHPALAGYKAVKDAGKSVYKFLLDKPQYTLHWKKGVEAMKKGDFKTAESNFVVLDNAIMSSKDKATKDALKKFRSTSKNSETIDITPKNEKYIEVKLPKK